MSDFSQIFRCNEMKRASPAAKYSGKNAPAAEKSKKVTKKSPKQQPKKQKVVKPQKEKESTATRINRKEQEIIDIGRFYDRDLLRRSPLFF
jgi:hypothetical protein